MKGEGDALAAEPDLFDAEATRGAHRSPDVVREAWIHESDGGNDPLPLRVLPIDIRHGATYTRVLPYGMIETLDDIHLDFLRETHVRLYYFGLGFIQLKIDETSRLHFYHPELPTITEDAHNHRYGFLSRILAGQLTNSLYIPVEGDTHVLVNESCNPEIKAPGRREPIGLIDVDVQTYRTGQSYVMTDSLFHRVKAGPTGCVTYLVRTHHTKEFAQVILPKNATPVCPFSKKIPDDELWSMMEDMLG